MPRFGAELAQRLVQELGGRYSSALGIDVDAGDDQVECWALAATLFGSRIPASVAERTYRVLAGAGVHRLEDVAVHTWDELVALLDEGGYVRYDFVTATRLRKLAEVLAERYEGRISTVGRAHVEPRPLEEALDELPGWGPVTVSLFLRELRGVWPGARPVADVRAVAALEHLGVAAGPDPLGCLARLAGAAGLDLRDLESGLVRFALLHARDMSTRPGAAACRLALRLGLRAAREPGANHVP